MSGGNTVVDLHFFASTAAQPARCDMYAMLQAVIFDVDGTLIDSVDAHAHTWTETLRDFGYEVDFDDVRYQIGKGGDQLMAEFLSKRGHR